MIWKVQRKQHTLAKVEDPVGRACSRCRAERPLDKAYASKLLSASKKALKMPLGNHAALTPLEDMSAGRQASGGSPPNCQRIYIQRDYSEGTVIKFQTRFPAELENRLDRQTFEYTINQLNTYFAEAERATCSTYCEGCLACLTGYLIYICTETQYEKCLRKTCVVTAH